MSGSYKRRMWDFRFLIEGMLTKSFEHCMKWGDGGLRKRTLLGQVKTVNKVINA